MACDCIDKVNGALEEAGEVARLDIPYIVNLQTLEPKVARCKISMYKLDSKSRGRLPTICAVYCPFCGKKYVEYSPDSPSVPADAALEKERGE